LFHFWQWNFFGHSHEWLNCSQLDRPHLCGEWQSIDLSKKKERIF